MCASGTGSSAVRQWSPEHTEAERRQARERARERLQGAMTMLEEGIGGILDSESFSAYLRAMSRFHRYSPQNVALILAQRPDATRVAGYESWRKLGRQVKRGERGIVILVPLRNRIAVEVAAEGGGEADETLVATRFGTARVFDVSQTEGDPLPEPPAAEAIRTATRPGRELYRRLEGWLRSRGVAVGVADLGEPLGEYAPRSRSIRIHEGLAGTDHAAKTLAHEAAHHVAEHTGATAREDAESVAEGVAYVVMQHYGIETGGYSFAYVARWAEDRKVLTRNLGAISAAARTIIDGLEGEDGEDAGEDRAA